MTAFKYLSLSSLLLCLAACSQPFLAKEVSSLSTTQAFAPASQANLKTAKPDSFEISGALAAKYQNKGWSALLNWLQKNPDTYQIYLAGPFGSRSLLISKEGNSITLRNGSKITKAPDAETLLAEQTGIYLPLHHLYYWLRGLPAPGKIKLEKRHTNGQLYLLKQDGFIIEYPQYLAYKQQILPGQIRIQGQGILIKLHIKRWRMP